MVDRPQEVLVQVIARIAFDVPARLRLERPQLAAPDVAPSLARRSADDRVELMLDVQMAEIRFELLGRELPEIPRRATVPRWLKLA